MSSSARGFPIHSYSSAGLLALVVPTDRRSGETFRRSRVPAAACGFDHVRSFAVEKRQKVWATMTDGMSFPPEATPYTWDASHPPSPDILKLWTEVGNGIDKSQTGEFSWMQILLLQSFLRLFLVRFF